MIIDGREIGPGHSPYVIAEISCNHNGSLDKALKLIEAASAAEADAVKFQCYEADTITIDHDSHDFVIHDGPWKGRHLHELYSRTQTPYDWFPTLFEHARSVGITAFASVFDRTSVDLLESLRCPAYKIASMEITDTPLIEYAALTGKPIIISTGMANKVEIVDAIRAAARQGIDDLGLLQCTSGYPTRAQDADLLKLTRMDWYHGYDITVGISDHTQGWDVPVAATALGACIIEKHLMLGDEFTEDFDFSLAPFEFKIMVKKVRDIWRAMQPPREDVGKPTRQLRRSLYVVKDIKAGEPFTKENVRSIRPAYGLAPGELPWVLTQIAAVDLKRGTALKRDHISCKTNC